MNPFAIRLDERARVAAAAADRALRRGQARPAVRRAGDDQGLAVAGRCREHLGLAGQGAAGADRTCAAVELLEHSGAVVFATTATPEFCYTGITESRRHGHAQPWNAIAPGGSSGGAGAAVAAGAGPSRLGGDGGGSIHPKRLLRAGGAEALVRPGAREPCGPAWYSLVSNGPMARSVAPTRG
jgi:hypothetical protein